MSKLYILTALMSLLTAPLTSAAQSGNVGDIFNRTWYIVAMKCPDEVSKGTQPGQQENYYFSMKFTPNNLNSANNGKYERISREIGGSAKEEGNYVVNATETNAGKIVLEGLYTQPLEYLLNIMDENHITLTLLTDAPQERCKVYYAVAAR